MVLLYMVTWIPSTKTPFMLAYIAAPWIPHGNYITHITEDITGIISCRYFCSRWGVFYFTNYSNIFNWHKWLDGCGSKLSQKQLLISKTNDRDMQSRGSDVSIDKKLVDWETPGRTCNVQYVFFWAQLSNMSSFYAQCVFFLLHSWMSTWTNILSPSWIFSSDEVIS